MAHAAAAPGRRLSLSRRRRPAGTGPADAASPRCDAASSHDTRAASKPRRRSSGTANSTKSRRPRGSTGMCTSPPSCRRPGPGRPSPHVATCLGSTRSQVARTLRPSRAAMSGTERPIAVPPVTFERLADGQSGRDQRLRLVEQRVGLRRGAAHEYAERRQDTEKSVTARTPRGGRTGCWPLAHAVAVGPDIMSPPRSAIFAISIMQ